MQLSMCILRSLRSRQSWVPIEPDKEKFQILLERSSSSLVARRVRRQRRQHGVENHFRDVRHRRRRRRIVVVEE